MKALAIVALLLLVGCQPPLDQGYVTDREFSPAHTTTVLVPQYITVCRPSGTSTICTPQLSHFLPIYTHYPDKWRLRVENGDREEWIEVPQSTYEAIMVGDFWRAPARPP